MSLNINSNFFTNVGFLSAPIGKLNISNDLIISNDEYVNGDLDITKYLGGSSTGTLSTGSTTFNLINTNATTVNFAGDATSLNIGGGPTSTITLRGDILITSRFGEKSVPNMEIVYILPVDDGDGLVASVAPASGTVLTLIATNTVANKGGTNSATKLGPSRKLTVTHNSGDAGDFVDFVGTDQFGNLQSETLTLVASSETVTAAYWSSITSATFRTASGGGSISNPLTIGWVSSGKAAYYTVGYKDSGVTIIDINTAVHSTLLQSSTAVNFRQWSFTMINTVANATDNLVYITTAGDDKIYGITQPPTVVASSSYVPVTSPASNAFAYTATANSLVLHTTAAQNKLTIGSTIKIVAAYNFVDTDNTVFFTRIFQPAAGSDSTGASVFA